MWEGSVRKHCPYPSDDAGTVAESFFNAIEVNYPGSMRWTLGVCLSGVAACRVAACCYHNDVLCWLLRVLQYRMTPTTTTIKSSTTPPRHQHPQQTANEFLQTSADLADHDGAASGPHRSAPAILPRIRPGHVCQVGAILVIRRGCGVERTSNHRGQSDIPSHFRPVYQFLSRGFLHRGSD
eukprot:1516834-Rhodomonas_salina.5